MPSPRAMMKKMKRKQDWHSARQMWPEVGQTVNVMAMVVCKATLKEAKPHRIWDVHLDASQCEEVKFWLEDSNESVS